MRAGREPSRDGALNLNDAPPRQSAPSAADLQAVLSLPENQALAVSIASRLRDALLAGYFGPGEQLREEPLARSMGVSRGPVREALLRLEREGLVVVRRNRGAFVARLSAQDLEEVYTLRVAIECLAVRRVVRLATDAELDALQAVVDQMAAADARGVTEQEAAELDLRFHDLVYLASQHRRLNESWGNLRPQAHILLLNRNVAREDFREFLVQGHQWIVDAVRDRDEDRAVATIEDHLRGSYERVAAGLDLRAGRTAGEGADGGR
ncbi:MAG: GntR family transcriptional regulator [Chloroflexia bacterium]|nr:GntR family transcriptional regulator [Chloroflexia bacterium]